MFLFAGNKAALNADFTRILHDLQGGLGGPMATSRHGIVHDLQRLFAVSIRNLYLVGLAIAAYAALEGVEAIGLWLGRRWAEYLTFVATLVFVPYEIHELTKSVTALKVLALGYSGCAGVAGPSGPSTTPTSAGPRSSVPPPSRCRPARPRPTPRCPAGRRRAGPAGRPPRRCRVPGRRAAARPASTR